MQMPADQFVQVNGLRTRYWSAGEMGRPLLLVHGAGASLDYWYRNIHALAAHHRVYALDWVGSGQSEKPSGTYSYDDLTEFIVQFMDAVSLSSVNLLGTSVGGILAIKLAARWPRRVEKLVLVGSAGLGKKLSLGMRLSTMPFVGEILNRPGRATAKFLIRQCAHNSDAFLTEDFIGLVARNIPLDVLQFQLRTFRTAANAWGMKSDCLKTIKDMLPTITAPTLVIWGQQDLVTPMSGAEVAIREIPNASFHLFSGCGHWPYLEYADEFNQVILSFLAP